MIKIGAAGFADPDGFATARLGRDVLYLIRPDQHVAARFNAPTFAAVSQALRRAKGLADAAAQVAA